MRLHRFLLAAILLAPSCHEESSVDLGLVMIAPQGISDAESIDLYVFDPKGVTCDANGHASDIPSGRQKFSLSREGCGDGLAWCADIVLDKDGTKKMFAAIARAGGAVLYEGCTTAKIDQDPLDVTIEMKRAIEPGCCGDGIVQPLEQCDPGGLPACGLVPANAVCREDCTSQEVLLSIDDFTKPLLTNAPHTKGELAMAFCPGNAQIGSALRAVYRSNDTKATGGSDINVRVMYPDLFPIAIPQPLSLQLRLPLVCSAPYGNGGKAVDLSPSIAPVGQNATLMVYSSNELQAGNSDIFLVVHTEDVCSDTTADLAARQINLPVSAPGATLPDIAKGPEGTALVVWQQQAQIVGRIWQGGVLVPENGVIAIGNGQLPKVAGGPNGWVVVYQGAGAGDTDGGILKRSVDVNGVPGAEVLVNGGAPGLQDQPDVAMLDTGHHAVVWRFADNIFFQRFDPQGAPIPGDQDAPLPTDNPTRHASPAIAAPLAGGDSFVAAWENEDGGISARYLGASGGFRFNNVSGQNDSFLASPLGFPSPRHRPAIAIGSYVVIGWQDDSDTHPGIYARRFPLPQ